MRFMELLFAEKETLEIVQADFSRFLISCAMQTTILLL